MQFIPEFISHRLPLGISVSQKTLVSLKEITPKYGNLLLDLCISVYPDADEAQQIFWRMIRKTAQDHAHSTTRYKKYERMSVLRSALSFLETHSKEKSPSHDRFEWLTQNSKATSTDRLNAIFPILDQLPVLDRCLLILRDKHGLSWEELAPSFKTEQSSLQFRYVQALRELERRIWT